ncbi:putative DNA-binding protein [Minicystis rosea]|nr:putative DNA-binding protein [Minicystis rosea]
MDLREVAGFLRARRERLKPGERGLSSLGRRRTPGLRRDEVADLAGISTEYYTQLEQARGRQPSRAVLERIAEALGLTRHERAVLFELAGIATAYPERPIATPGPGVLHILERLPDAVVTVHDAKQDVIAWNPFATALFGDMAALPAPRRNLARRFFLPRPGEPPHFGLTGGERYGLYLVAKIRQAASRYPKDPDTRRLIDDLMPSESFRALWDESDARYTPERHMVKTTDHPRVGRIELDCVALYVPEDDQEIVMLTAKPGSVSAARLRALSAT